jgi:predicted P-loop ATPase
MSTEEYLKGKYDFHFNQVTSRTFYKNKREKEFELLKNYKFNSIKRELTNNSIKTNVSELRSLLESDFVCKYNPFEDYFNNLPKWDGKDHIQELCNTIKTTNDEDYFWAFKKWLVAFVSCSINPEVTNQTIFILTGGQGIGKTTWLKKIVPNKLKNYFFSGEVNPTNKDTTLLMTEKILVNLDELASLNKKQLESFKEMVTKSVITERRAYGHFSEDYIRRASFVGSSNHNEILLDETGNRRFLIFEANEINYLHNIDMNLVYSQVMHILNNTDFQCHFVREDIKRVEKNNEKYMQSCEVTDWITELFEKPSIKNTDVTYMRATDIVNHIKHQKNHNGRIDVQKIGKIMTSKGYKRKKIKGSNKYEVVKK